MDISEKLKALQDGIGEKLDAKLKEHGENQAKMGDDLKAEFKGEVRELTDQYSEMQKQLDAIDGSIKKSLTDKPKSFRTELYKELNSNANFKAFAEGQTKKASMTLKTMITPTNASGEVVPSDRISGIKFDPTRAVRVRQFMSSVPMSGNRLLYTQETSYDNQAATTAEGSAYQESSFKLDAIEDPATKIGSFITLSKEMLEDVPMLNAYISNRLPNKVWNVEDFQLLKGAGTGSQLQGIMTSGGFAEFNETSTGAFYQFFPASQSDYTNEFDVLVAAKNQATLAEYSPTVTLLNPTDYHKMLLRKDADANYVTFVNGVLTVYGIPVFVNTAIPDGEFVIGDFAQACTLGLRDSMEIEFSDSHEDNFTSDLITIKASERVALGVHNPRAGVWGTFSSAITAITKP